MEWIGCMGDLDGTRKEQGGFYSLRISNRGDLNLSISPIILRGFYFIQNVTVVLRQLTQNLIKGIEILS